MGVIMKEVLLYLLQDLANAIGKEGLNVDESGVCELEIDGDFPVTIHCSQNYETITLLSPIVDVLPDPVSVDFVRTSLAMSGDSMQGPHYGFCSVPEGFEVNLFHRLDASLLTPHGFMVIFDEFLQS